MRLETIFGNMNKEPVILAIETSSRTGSVALGVGERIISEISFSGFLRHSAEIFPSIERLLSNSGIKPNQIEQVYISNGPGSFTGLRIAATFAKMMYLANSLRIAAVDSLDVIAFNAIDAIKQEDKACNLYEKAGIKQIKKIASVLDAKRGRFFIALYDVIREAAEVSLVKVEPDSLIGAEEFIAKYARLNVPVWLLGDGLLYHKQDFQAEGINFLEDKYWSPRAGRVYFLGRRMARQNQLANPVKLKPFYLCRPEIRIKHR
jgi:tRNA threonylcarbamoyladenosine biosynthesis protein TsaB